MARLSLLHWFFIMICAGVSEICRMPILNFTLVDRRRVDASYIGSRRFQKSNNAVEEVLRN